MSVIEGGRMKKTKQKDIEVVADIDGTKELFISMRLYTIYFPL